MVLLTISAALLGLSAAALAVPTPTDSAPLQRRSEIPSDEIVGFPQTVPDNANGTLYLKYQPYLYVYNGCVPYPAVDAEGNINAGLDITGSSDGDCTSSPGQIYCRSAYYNGSFAILYSWFMPKDEPSDGLGHRWDWEDTVVWLSEDTTTLLGVATSEHGSYSTKTDPNLNGTHPTIEYVSYWPLDHQTAFTDVTGGMQPLIAWESLPTVAQTALSTFDFESALVPFDDARFTLNLEEASL